ncbi:MAG: hypothetical protein V5A36_03395 [Natronomonas sp.]
MAADTQHTVESATSDPGEGAYISPVADFLIITVFMSMFAVATVAVILP